MTKNMAHYRRCRMTKARMPMNRRHTHTTEVLRGRWHLQPIQALVDPTSKQNLPCDLVLNEKMKRMKLTNNITIISKLTNR
jgi:hypothetical protein